MGVLQLQKVGSTSTIKNANWEIVLTDPSLSYGDFNMPMSQDYIMTDILSPLGQKSILYNTVPKTEDEVIRIGLNFQEIDDANINNITIKAGDDFFNNWVVYLKDNRNGERVKVSGQADVTVNPPVQLNKLIKMGFTDKGAESGKYYFELHLKRAVR